MGSTRRPERLRSRAERCCQGTRVRRVVVFRERRTGGAPFVVGSPGTILVTGIAPVHGDTLGAASIPLIIFVTLCGWILCFLLAELSAMMPERTGGAPSTSTRPSGSDGPARSPTTPTASPPGRTGSAGSRSRR
jgi:hypothetical protein